MSGIFEGLRSRISHLDDHAEREKADYNSPLTYLFITLMLGGVNLLMLIKNIRNGFFIPIILWNLMLIYVMSSMIGQLRFPDERE
jgi:hypothetical protein